MSEEEFAYWCHWPDSEELASSGHGRRFRPRRVLKLSIRHFSAPSLAQTAEGSQALLMTTAVTEDTMIVTLRVSDLRDVVRAAVAEAIAAKGQHDLLDMKQVAERYRVGRDALLAAAKRGEIELSQGPRRKVLVRAAEVERWLTQKKYTPLDRTIPVDLEDWERQARLSIERDLASGRLRRLSPQEIEEARARRKREQAERKRERDSRRK